MVEIELDGRKVEVAEGSMVMQAAEKLGTYIPHFCYHKKLSVAANCRMCLVDVEKAPKAVPACATPVTQGMVVRTKSEKAVVAQKAVMEFLLINHPLDCPICDQGGECQLQDLAVGYGGSASRYAEEKRVIFHKNVGPLIAMEEMSRCIQCTRCVRFGQEVAGVMELGMVNRGEHSEISTFVGATVDSELSGNMIDICPVGALTSKPFRYSARTWELSRRKSVSPHDSTGANLVVQLKNGHVMRVVPFENETVNECWIADRDRFSYEALASADRLTEPMIKQGGEWHKVDWTTALDYVADGLKDIVSHHGASAIGALSTGHQTVEELYLLGRVMRGLGSDNVDFRLRHADFSRGPGARWLGTSIASLSSLDAALVVGSFLRKDHPLFAQRLRQAARHGGRIYSVHAVADDWLMPKAGQVVAAPSQWVAVLQGIAAAVAAETGAVSPFGGQPDDAQREIARGLLAGERKAVLLGNAAAQHPQATELLAAANWIAGHTGATAGYLTEDANTVGAQLARAQPQDGGLDAGQMLAASLRGYVLLGAEPEFDTADPAAATKALAGAAMVAVLTPFKSEGMLRYADVLLPVSPFTETAGTFINAEGRVQSFHGVAPPLGEARPAWKVLRVLGGLLGLDGFGYESATGVLEEALGEVAEQADISGKLSNAADVAPAAGTPGRATGAQPERIAEVPIYAADALVRRSPALQATSDARPPVVGVPPALWATLQLAEGELVRVRQGEGQAVLPVTLASGQAEGTLRVPAGHAATSVLGAMFGPITIEKL